MAKYKKKKSRGDKLHTIAGAGSQASAFVGPGNPGRSGVVSHPSPSYIRYKDLSPSDVHEGTASYGGSDYSDKLGSTVGQYSVAVKRGHSKTNFIFGGDLYKINNSSGSSYSKVAK